MLVILELDRRRDGLIQVRPDPLNRLIVDMDPALDAADPEWALRTDASAAGLEQGGDAPLDGLGSLPG